MTKSIFACAAVAVATLAAAPAAAEDVYFELINNSQRTLVQFYASPTYDQYWGYDILNGQVVRPGTSGTVTIADGETACVYDMLFVFEGGVEVTGQSDICRSARYVLQ